MSVPVVRACVYAGVGVGVSVRLCLLHNSVGESRKRTRTHTHTHNPMLMICLCAAMILIGIDDELGPQVLKCDPAGFFCGYKAVAAGTKMIEAHNLLEKRLKKNPTLDYDGTVQVGCFPLLFAHTHAHTHTRTHTHTPFPTYRRPSAA